MKRVLFLIVTICICLSMSLSMIGCGDSSEDNTPSTNQGNNSDTPAGFNWKKAGKGTGTVVPEPTMEYEINASSSYISVEVHNATESDFYSYVNRCESSGFEGNVGTATIPDIYFMAEHSDGYKLEVFFYEDEGYFSIYAAPKSN